MQVLVNKQLVKSKARLGQIALVVGLAAMAIAFFGSLQMAEPGGVVDWRMLLGSYTVLGLALLALSVARYHLARWSKHPRPDEKLGWALEEFDDKYYLLNYLPRVPVDHLLITPRGVMVLVAKFHAGNITNNRARWHRKFSVAHLLGGYSEGGIGNPTYEAARGVEAVKAQLASALGESARDVPVNAAVVFTGLGVKVRAVDPVVPVVTPDDLRNHVRSTFQENKLPPGRLEDLLRVFAPDREQYRQEAAPKGLEKKKAKPRPKMKAKVPVADQRQMGRNRAERRMR